MFKCLLCNGENTHVYDGTRFGVDLPLSDSVFFHLFSRSEQHDAMTQILTPQYTSATLQVYYCRLWGELRVLKKGHSRKLSIYTNLYKLYKHTTTAKKKKKEKEKKHYHDINIVIREMIYLNILSSQAFPFPWDE